MVRKLQLLTRLSGLFCEIDSYLFLIVLKKVADVENTAVSAKHQDFLVTNP